MTALARAADWSARRPRRVIAAALLLATVGLVAGGRLRPDVLPDLSNPQIVVLADWMGHPATEVAADVTAVLTGALAGTPGATAVRGSSMTGMAYVDVTFASAAALRPGREAIVARVAAVRDRLPAGARVDVGPEASSTGWVFQYALTDPTHGQPPRALRRLQDALIHPSLAAIPGVLEVAPVGGAVDELLIETRAEALRERALAFSDVVAALRTVAAARPRPSPSPSPSPEELQALPIPVPGLAGPVARLGDVARVRYAEAMPNGIADLGGGGVAVGGIVIAARDADLGALLPRLRAALGALRARLPAGVRLEVVYDRLEPAMRAQHGLLRALVEEIAVVVAVILLFLLHGPSALVPLVTLPVVLLATLAGMWLLGLPATVMSLGGIGIALGLAVDADVVALEACHRRLEGAGAKVTGAGRRAAVAGAAAALTPAILTALLITALTFLPVFAFTGESGRLLRPLALTKTLVILSAALVAVTLAPALRDRLLGGPVRPELDNPLTRFLIGCYRPFVHFVLARPILTLVTAALAVLSCVPIAMRLGGEFLPRVDEGDLLFMPTTEPGPPEHQTGTELRRMDRALADFAEVETVFGKIGRADTATDRAPLSMAETTIRLRPPSTWPARPRRRWYSDWAPPLLRRILGLGWPERTPLSTAELTEALDQASRRPGWKSAWTAPIRARIDMMSTGVQTPVGIRVVARGAARLEALGRAVRAIAADLPGTRSALLESAGGEARVALELDAAALARHGVDAGLARSTAALVIAGGQIGDVQRGGERLRLRVTPQENLRGPADRVRELTVRAGAAPAADGRPPLAGQPIALGLLGRARFDRVPASVRSEASVRGDAGEQVAYVYVDLGPGTDLLGYVERARHEIDGRVAAGALALGPGERIEWAGQYPLMVATERRLRWIVPAVVLSMLLLLFWQFRSFTEALIVLLSVPFALVGSVWTLHLVGYSLSAPVWVGMLSVVGLAMQTGVVMVVYIDEAFHRRLREGRLQSREDIVAAHAEGTVRRLRPKVMTVTTMAAGLLPLLWGDAPGSEIIRRVAAPMLGGLATSAFLTLEVIPVLYTLWRQRQLARAHRLGVPLAAVVGRAPTWAVEAEDDVGTRGERT